MTHYDAAGNHITPADVLDRDELADYERSLRDRGRAFKQPRTVVLPALDADGYDVDGYAWGAR